MSENLKLYNKYRAVPGEALKPIVGGRLKGMSDINPMWRIKALTEEFGMCGVGWFYEVVEQRLEQASDNQIAAFVTINLFVKVDGEWSKPIVGLGGSSFIAKETKGLYTNDECFKMALTDAIGIACKALGFAANVYFEKDRTKYDVLPNGEQQDKSKQSNNQNPKKETTQSETHKCSECDENLTAAVETFSIKKYGKPLCFNCQKNNKAI